MIRHILQRWRRFVALESSDRSLLVEAVVLIAVTRAALAMVPFRWLCRFLDSVKRIRARAKSSPGRVTWAIDAAARLMDRRTCLNDALAADVMLCRRGHPSTLRLGVRKRAGAAIALDAHAWVESDGVIITGRLDTLDDYRLLPDIRS